MITAERITSPATIVALIIKVNRMPRVSKGSSGILDIVAGKPMADVVVSNPPPDKSDDYRDGVEKTLAYLKKAGIIRNFSVKKEHAVVQQDDAEIGLMIPFE